MSTFRPKSSDPQTKVSNFSIGMSHFGIADSQQPLNESSTVVAMRLQSKLDYT